MEYVGFIFGIFGFLAYFELSGLKKRVNALEAQLAQTVGTSAYNDRQSLVTMIHSCVGKKVHIDLKEDYEDVDIIMHGNSKHGFNTILDVDKEWILVRVDCPKAVKEKLIRIEAIQSIQVM